MIGKEEQMRKSKKRGPGRPKGSRTRGPTVATSVRIAKELDEKLERIRRQGDVLLTKSQALERTIRQGLIRMGLLDEPTRGE